MFNSRARGVPQLTDLYFNYHGSGFVFIGTFKSKYAAKMYAYEHGHMHSTYDISWKITDTTLTAAKKQFDEKQVAKYRNWVAQTWYDFYTEKYGEDFLK